MLTVQCVQTPSMNLLPCPWPCYLLPDTMLAVQEKGKEIVTEKGEDGSRVPAYMGPPTRRQSHRLRLQRSPSSPQHRRRLGLCHLRRLK
jgi:hypothetical protein